MHEVTKCYCVAGKVAACVKNILSDLKEGIFRIPTASALRLIQINRENRFMIMATYVERSIIYNLRDNFSQNHEHVFGCK